MATRLQQLAAGGGSASFAAQLAALSQSAAGPALPAAASAGAQTDGNPLPGVWHWLTDMIDRPRRAIDNTIGAVSNAGYDFIDPKHAEKDGLGNAAAIVSAPFRGLFSTAHGDQADFGQVLMHSLVRGGEALGQDPKRLQAAADSSGGQVLQGVGGLVGDIGTDPLSFVGPGAVKGVFGGVKGAVTALTGGKTVEKVTEAAAKAGAVDAAASLEDVSHVPGRQTETFVPDTPKPAGATSADTAAEDLLKPQEKAPPEIDVPVEVAPPEVKPLVQVVPETGAAGVVLTDEARIKQLVDFGGMTPEAAREHILGTQAEQDVAKALPSVLSKHFNTKNYDVALGESGFKATDEVAGAGFAKHPNQMGTHAQWNHLQALQNTAIADANRLNLRGPARANYVMSRTGAALDLSEQLLDKQGIVLHMDHLGERIPLSMGQALHVLGDTPERTNLLKSLFANGSTRIAPTKFQEALVMAVRGDPIEDIAVKLTEAEKGRYRPGEIPKDSNFLSGALTAERKGVVGIAGKKRTYLSNQQALGDLLDAIETHRSDLVTLVNRNAGQYQERFGNEYITMSNDVKDAVQALVDDPTRLGDALAAISRPGVKKTVAAIGKENGTLVESAHAAADEIHDTLPPGAQDNADAALKMESASKPKPGKPAGDPVGQARARRATTEPAAAQAQKRAAFVESQVDPEVLQEPPAINLAERVSVEEHRKILGGVQAFLDPAAKLFKANWALDDQVPLYNLENVQGVLRRTYIARSGSAINQIRKLGAEPLIEGTERTVTHQALDDALHGIESADERVAGVRAVLDPLLNEMIPLRGGNNLLSSRFFRTGASVDWMNDQFARSASGTGVLSKITFDTEKAASDSARLGISPLQAAMQQLSEAKISDPLGFLSELSHISTRAAYHASIASNAERMLTDVGLAARKATKGLVPIKFDKSSPLGAFISTDLRVDPEAAIGLQRLNELMTGKSGQYNRFLKEVFDPIQQAWKFSVTLPRPGHHVRNLLGDVSMTFLAEGPLHAVRASRDAMKILAAHHTYEGMDLVDALTRVGANDFKGIGETLTKGKLGEFTNADLYKAFAGEGLLPKFADVEQLAGTGGSGKLARFSEALTRGNKVSKALGNVSEARDHFSRMQHAMVMLHKAQESGYVTMRWGKKVRPRDADHAFELIAQRVRQFHPDGMALSQFERTYMRRMIPFYSWMRGALPAVAESLVMHPGRVTTFSKGSYALATAAGVHPDSLANPFPTDQMFPSFLSEQVQGPQLKIGGSYFSISPGIAPWDLAKTLGGDPAGLKNGILGSVSPLIRDPIEVATGTNLSTGSPIRDWSDYVDQQLPGISNVASLTGYSPTGSVAGIVSGNGLDPKSSVRKGQDTAFSGLGSGLLGLLTGVSVTNESKGSYQKIAQLEQKAKNTSSKTSPTGF